jgi:hypothetical protein
VTDAMKYNLFDLGAGLLAGLLLMFVLRGAFEPPLPKLVGPPTPPVVAETKVVPKRVTPPPKPSLLIKDARLLIRKHDRRLDLFSGDNLIKSCTIGLGFEPFGDKEERGDGRTPEGVFYVFTKNPESSYHLSLGLSYPNGEDAGRGLLGGLIDFDEYDEIIKAQHQRNTPPMGTKLGGDIYIHGRGSDSDWTLGCVALNDDDVQDLFNKVPIGAEVVIIP